MMLHPGEKLADRYRVVREIGAGGFGRVYLAEELERRPAPSAGGTLELSLGDDLVLRKVALKTFGERPRLWRELVSELRALCRLSHPNIVAVFDYQPENPPFIAMEYVEGRNLRDWLEENGPFGVDDALVIARQIGAALTHAHSVGLLHRDVKPSNAIMTESLRVKLVDFGLARKLERLGNDTVQVGTPGFVAPELLDPDRFTNPVQVTADVYGLGCLLCALLTGAGPFASDSPLQTLRLQLDGRRHGLDDVHPALRATIERATALEPSQRYPSVAALLDALRRVQIGLSRQSGVHRNDTRIELNDAQLLSIEPFLHPKRGRGLKFELSSIADGDVHRGFAYEGTSVSGRDLFASLAGAWVGSEVSLYHAREVVSETKGRFVTVDHDTLPVLEPHFLVSVTDVVRTQGVRARDCSSRTWVDIRDGFSHSRPTVMGRIIHDILDMQVREPLDEQNFEAYFGKALEKSRVEAVAAGVSDRDLPMLKRECEPSFDWLDRFVQRNIQGHGSSAEVTRYSGRYGLEGRIDLAVLTDEQLGIFELKSGRRQRRDHEAQLRCYSLLWDAFAQTHNREISGRLLYSQAGLIKKVPRQDHALERQILRGRNHLIAAHFAFMRGRFEEALPYFGQFSERCNDSPCQYRTKRCATQCADIGLGEFATAERAVAREGPWEGVAIELVQAARQHYRHFVRLIETEFIVQSRSQGDFTRADGLQARLETSDAVGEAELLEWDEGLNAARFTCEKALTVATGTDVILHRGDPDTDATLVGRVEQTTANTITVSAAGVQMFGHLPRKGWFLDRIRPRIGYREAHRALYGLLRLRDPLRLHAVLFGGDPTDPPARPKPPPATLMDSPTLRALNVEQREAVSTAFAARHRPVLIHGPPGTGKTTVIAALLEAFARSNQRVLVAAGTNTAVDNILEHCLSRELDFLRLGGLEPRSRLLRLRSRRELAQHVERELGRSETSLDAIAQRLRDAPIVAGTAHRCVSSAAIAALTRLLGKDPGVPLFDVAIVDEATQLSEPLCLGAVLLARRFILVGDARQLPPVITAEEATSAVLNPTWANGRPDLSRRLDLRGLDWTLFERLEGRAPEIVLTTQYRMNAQIQAPSNRLFYAGQLRADASVASHTLELDPEWLAGLPARLQQRLDPARPFVWETPRAHSGSGVRRNLEEVSAIVETISALLSGRCEVEAHDIGVISPFRAQCHALRTALGEALGAQVAQRIEVDTVERFQGREKEVVLLSLVVPTWSDFVMNDRRLNVAFTRARSKLIVFGPAQLLYRLEGATVDRNATIDRSATIDRNTTGDRGATVDTGVTAVPPSASR